MLKSTRSFSRLLAIGMALACQAQADSEKRFDFGSGPVANGFTEVTGDSIYTSEAGFGFLGNPEITDVVLESPDALRSDGCVLNDASLFVVDLPEGNYNVNLLVLGGSDQQADLTVKAEARRLMLLNQKITPGAFEEVGFTVNIRTPEFGSDSHVSLNKREIGTVQWDGQLSLEFFAPNTAIAAMKVTPAVDAITVFLAGDSTVTDQREEPWAGWGQILPSFFKQGVAVANYAESGRALYSFRAEKRLDKILSVLKPEDYVFIQFGHNDQKDKSEGAGPFTTYKEDLEEYVAAIRGKRGIPVLVTPMERRRWKDGHPQETLTDYSEAMRQVGAEANVPVIDLHAMSLRLYAALGEQGTKAAFVHYPANTFPGQSEALKDDTHHNAFGAYELARCVVNGINEKLPDLAKHLRADATTFDPSKPDSSNSIVIPASPSRVLEIPEGN